MSNHAMYRPPGEAFSLVLRVMDGCPWNKCSFCGMYKGVPLNKVPKPTWLSDLRWELSSNPKVRRLFLADGDVCYLPFDELADILRTIKKVSPQISRINLYANGLSILNKTEEELSALKEMGLHTLYMGLESGSDEVLQAVHKRERADDMIKAGQLAQKCGLRLSVMVLTGLGGQTHSDLHARETARVLNQMQPRLLSLLRVIPVKGTGLGERQQAGTFTQLTEAGAIREMRQMIELLDLNKTVFRANHVSNIAPLEGRFPHDKDKLLTQLQQMLSSGMLSEDSSGDVPQYL